MDTWEVYFQTILILNANVYASHVSKRCGYSQKALLATYGLWSQEIQYLGKAEYNICCSINYRSEIHGCKCRDTKSHVTSSITWANGSAYRHSILMITDHPGDHHHTLNIVILAKKLLVIHSTRKVLLN